LETIVGINLCWVDGPLKLYCRGAA
jgi:hypothetical protein